MSGGRTEATGAWRRWRIGRSGPVELACVVLIALYMAASGGFDTDRKPAVVRFPYWLIVLVGGGVIAALIEPVLTRFGLLTRRPILLAAAVVVVATPPIALLVWVVSSLIVGASFRPERYLDVVPSVFVVLIAVVILVALLRIVTARVAPSPPAAEAPGGVPAALAERLTPRLARARLLAVEAEDHYLRIHTDLGEALILMRFSDALEALADSPGLRTHRSWWVARRAVDDVRWQRGRGALRLANGVVAPVSRTYADAVRAASWV